MTTGDAVCPATTQIHAGYRPQEPYRPVAVPLYQSAAYEFPDYASARSMFALKEPGFTYTRTGNPTVAVLEQRIAALDGGTAALATATGQAAVAIALLALVRGGQHLVASSKLYGGTVDLLTDTFADFGIEVSFADPADPAAWQAAVRPQTRAFLTESIGNPLATLQDLPAIAAAAHAAGVPLVVDNTLATPALYRPLDHGADIVVYSATKFLGGHGTALAGAVVDGGRFDFSAYPDKWPQLTRPKRRYGGDTLWQRHGRGAYLALARSKYLHDLGPSLSPFNAVQILQGLETLDIRVARHGQNTQEVVRFLAGHPAVAAVHHPSVPGHPQAALAARDFPQGAGSVFSFDLAADPDQVGPFIDRLRLFKLVANVGDTRSLVSHPAAMTHCRLSAQQRAAAGIAETTVRLSVGLEAAADLVADLAQALAPLAAAVPAGIPAAGAPAAVVHAGTEA
jgi:O-acetylhomoserine (thiol)-lyase